MLTQPQVMSSLLFFAVSYIVLSLNFRDSLKKDRKNQLFTLAAIFAIFALKMGYDMKSLPQSHYGILQVGRHSSTLDIRRSYKSLSRRYHPDKNPSERDAEMFQAVKASYDILMDESQREIYNRFGEGDLEFDPRKDEMKLISDISTVYLYWIVCSYIMTLPAGAQASRTWLIIIGIAVMALEVCFCLTETAIPEWAPESLTEYELLFYLHSCFPLFIAALRCLAESLYVDIDQTSIAVLRDFSVHQKALYDMVQQLQSLVEAEVGSDPSDANAADRDSNSQQRLESAQQQLLSLRDQMDSSNDSTSKYIEALKNCSSNPGSNYYWIIFVALYGGIYFLQ
mmetsp:Transcript_25551/g.42838  ORF Transcript_25551/g.42838 Transcript_25551/m.42838 type:complete len:340 (-) Transcript_25551:283-1302(-)